jgi:hypothetical protein
VPAEAHLQMIQSVVSRLSAQSTTVKGWCVTVTAALLGYGATAATPVVAALAIYVVLAFAVLDAYYLALERAYRVLYRHTVDGRAGDWTLDVALRPRDVGAALRSPAISILYGVSLVTAVAVAGYLLLR